MPWLSPDSGSDLSAAVAGRWQAIDPMLPAPAGLPAGCGEPLIVPGPAGRPEGIGICCHQRIADEDLDQVWGTIIKLELIPRLRTAAALDELLGQWHGHLAAAPEATAKDSAAVVTWPSRDLRGVNALLAHGMQPLTVLAARPARRPLPTEGTPTVGPGAGSHPDLVIREGRPDDLDAAAALEMGVIRHDAQVGTAIMRPATEVLVREDTRRALAACPAWIWVAERAGRLTGLVHVQPPPESGWIAVMTRPGTTAYLQSMYVTPDERGGGVGAELVRRAHDELDARGINTTLLHYSQLNPLSVPFWSRMGYQPLWTIWEARPPAALRP